MRASLSIPLAGLLVATASSAQQLKDGPPPPPTAEQKQQRAAVFQAPYRFDDLVWENDRTAHRIYGKALEKNEPPSGSGIDAWGKRVAWPFAERRLRTGGYHNDNGEGIDFYHVGGSRGAGGLGIWYDNKLWTSRNYIRYRILNPGPDVADFSVDYAPWPVDVKRRVWETRRFTLPAGTSFTRMVSTLQSDTGEPLIVGIGLNKTAATKPGHLTVDRAAGKLVWWGPPDAEQGRMGVAVMVDPASIVEVRSDADNHLVLVRATPGRPFVYYTGATWDKGGAGIRDEAAWKAYVQEQKPDFTPPKN